MLSTRKLIQQSLRNVRSFSTGSRIILSQKSSSSAKEQRVVVVPMQTPFIPDRAGRLPLNLIPQLIEVGSFYAREETVGQMFNAISKNRLLSVAKTQEINIFPEFYKHWKTNDNLQIHCQLHDVGTKSFNLQFDIYNETSTVMLCRNIRSIVVCDVKMKPQIIPKDTLDFLKSNAVYEERYFIPPAFKSKSGDTYETSTIVKPSDLDVYFHLNQANYLEFMLDAAVSAARSGAYKSLKQDIAFASVNQIILNYARELCLDENVKIETWEDNEHPMKLCFEMSSGAKVAFQGCIILQEPLVKLSDEIKRKFPRAQEF